jgi:glycosyltransferase involved in cell wall biosynthesis
VGDIPEILGETGYLADPGDSEQIAAQIQLIFQDLNAANARGVKARQRCVEKYSLQAMANALEAVMTGL